MNIKILGTGCPKCKQLEENAKKASQELALGCEITKVTDLDQIMDYWVMMTPALAIDNQVKSVGKVLSVEEIKTLIEKEKK